MLSRTNDIPAQGLSADIPYGYCQCGCGQKTDIAKRTDSRQGHVKGKHYNFVKNHHRLHVGPDHHNWKGGRKVVNGYFAVKAPLHHPRANKQGYVLEHILIIEKEIGRYIKLPEEIHHIDENRRNNKLDNLVLCKDHMEHAELHMKSRAAKACGHAEWRKCFFCKEYDDPTNLVVITRPKQAAFHKKCRNEYQKQLRQVSKKEVRQ